MEKKPAMAPKICNDLQNDMQMANQLMQEIYHAVNMPQGGTKLYLALRQFKYELSMLQSRAELLMDAMEMDQRMER